MYLEVCIVVCVCVICIECDYVIFFMKVDYFKYVSYVC